VSEQRVRIETEGGVADVRMVRGSKHNALDWEMFEALDRATDELAVRNDVRAIVLSGDGPSFCSGLDFPSFIGGEVTIEQMLARRDGDAANIAQGVAVDWQRLEAPVIAALHGACFGGGLQIALGADLRVAHPETRLSVMEVKYGLIPDMGLTQTLPPLVPLDVAKELTWSGRVVGAPEALELGLVTQIADDPLAAATELAREIAARSPHAIRSGKRLLNDAYRSRSEAMLALEAELQAKLLGTPNQIAAVQAAMTKQPAEFADPD